MTRRTSGLVALIALTLAGRLPRLAAPPSGGVAECTQSQPPSADQAFSRIVDGYLEGLFHFDLTRATRAGFHQYDAELPAYSRRDMETEIARSKACLEELGRIARGSLSKENQFDARMLESAMRGHALDLEQIRMWEKDPNFYNNAISRALYALVQRDFASLDERLKSLIARERKVPEVLRSARLNLANPPAIYTQIAIRQVEFEIRYLRDELPQAVARARDAPRLAEFKETNQRTIEEYEKFLDFLRSSLTPHSHGAFPIGAENFRKKLLYDEMVDTPLDELLKIAERELRKTQGEFQATAAIIDPTKPPAEVLKDLSREHPDAAHLLGDTQSGLDGLRKFIVSHRIVTIPTAENPQVIETPPFMRALTFASMDTPGPFEQVSTQAFYNVTLPDPNWSEEEKDQHLRFFDRYSILGTSIHEVFPGHYTQFLWVKRAPTKVRKLLGCSSNAEGWAHYAEQMMLEEGFGEGDPKLLLVQLRAALLRLCRFLVGIRMHARGMTLEEGTAFFEKEGYLERVNAEREAMRGTADPTYLVYTLGKLQILKLREDYKNKVGDRFSLQEFHERFLSFGYPPIKIIREEMLGDNSPPL